MKRSNKIGNTVLLIALKKIINWDKLYLENIIDITTEGNEVKENLL